MTSYCGIDFGTTNTALVHYSDDSSKRSYVGESGTNDPMPSLVSINIKTGETCVGKQVKDNFTTLSNDDYKIIFSVKTILEQEKITDRKGKPIKKGGKILTPVDVATEIFKQLKTNAEQKKLSCNESIISVPVNFSAIKRRNLKEAAKAAGINITKFVSEPTAAFISHYKQLKNYKDIVVFDWGGGTLDISALSVENDSIQEIYTTNLYKAGNDIDRSFAQIIYEKQSRNLGLRPISLDDLSPAEYDELLTKTEIAKIALTKKDTVKDILTLQEKEETVTFTYDELKQASKSYIDEAMEKLSQTIEIAFKGKNPSRILCVGGSTKLRYLQERLKEKYGNLLCFPQNPDWDIAEGACTIAAEPEGKNVYMLAHDLNLQLSDGSMIPLLPEGQPIPCKANCFYVATVDSNEFANFVFSVKEGEKKFVTIPVLGGIDEALQIFAFVDEFFVFHVYVENLKMHEMYDVFACEDIELRYNI